MKTKKTLIIGASPKESRYSYMAVTKLTELGHEAIPVGIRNGLIAGIEIITGMPKIDDVHTVTLYVGPQNQPPYYNYVLSLKPKRVIFNPGTENDEFHEILKENNVEVLVACTLVLLTTGQY
ncbi:MAG: CoA-binding protein [Candidatus Margulisbacteria bacterium]|nr:CoA-binding protein [Candidatus Margulisiibacteriota bacterium]